MQGRLLKVVVAEDSDAYLLRIRAALSQLPVEVVGTAKTSVEAISLIERFRPDLIVLDIFLLEGSGVDVLHHLNTVGSQARRVVMTSEQSPEIAIGLPRSRRVSISGQSGFNSYD